MSTEAIEAAEAAREPSIHVSLWEVVLVSPLKGLAIGVVCWRRAFRPWAFPKPDRALPNARTKIEAHQLLSATNTWIKVQTGQSSVEVFKSNIV